MSLLAVAGYPAEIQGYQERSLMSLGAQRSIWASFRSPNIGQPGWARVRGALLACGALSSLLYIIGIDVIAALRYPEYHRYASQMVSELMAVAAPTRTLLIWLFIPYNLLVFAFAVGVWASARENRAARLTAAALVGYGILSTAGLLLTPMDMRGTLDSQRDTLHIAATFVMSIFIVAVIASGAFVFGIRFRLYSFATIATLVAFGLIAGFLSRPMPDSTPWVGVAERINIYVTMLWMLVFSVSLLSRQNLTL
jgi:Protein of unknown function (DUF998)